mmetsp:Transcript_78230/g.221226  ORF Transcript_78230/g.221226 Transcript_78230/m.221226 type:complete len:216 (+) Transcript_78230:157-804(+)
MLDLAWPCSCTTAALARLKRSASMRATPYCRSASWTASCSLCRRSSEARRASRMAWNWPSASRLAPGACWFCSIWRRTASRTATQGPGVAVGRGLSSLTSRARFRQSSCASARPRALSNASASLSSSGPGSHAAPAASAATCLSRPSRRFWSSTSRLATSSLVASSFCKSGWASPLPAVLAAAGAASGASTARRPELLSVVLLFASFRVRRSARS